MQALEAYRKLISELDQRCEQILKRQKDHIACSKGCAGNCCRIHLSVYTVEAASMALALQQQPKDMRFHIQRKARKSTSFGPCPLLEDGACLMYDARAVICRTHGLPMLTEYRGRRAIGHCEKNFRNLSSIPEEDIIDLGRMNTALRTVNQHFSVKVAHVLPPATHLTMAQALTLKI